MSLHRSEPSNLSQTIFGRRFETPRARNSEAVCAACRSVAATARRTAGE